MKKRFLAAMAGMMALGMLVLPAQAKPIPMASVNGVDFNTLTEAIQVANQYPGSTVEILSDATYGSTMLTFEDVTINLNGYTITRTNSEARWYIGGAEEPEDLGSEAPETLPVVVINGGDGSTITDADDAEGEISTPHIAVQYADITINDVDIINKTYDEDSSAFCIRDSATATLNNCNLEGWAGLKIYREYGTGTSYLTVNGGSIVSKVSADTTYKSSAVLGHSGVNYDTYVTFDGVTISSENSAAIALTPRCYVTIKDCTLTGTSGIYFTAGSLDIQNSEITATGEFLETPPHGKDQDGAYTVDSYDGSGIQIISDNKFNEPIEITISDDSTITSANGYAIREIGGKDGTGESLVELETGNAELNGALGDVGPIAVMPAQEETEGIEE